MRAKIARIIFTKDRKAAVLDRKSHAQVQVQSQKPRNTHIHTQLLPQTLVQLAEVIKTTFQMCLPLGGASMLHN